MWLWVLLSTVASADTSAQRICDDILRWQADDGTDTSTVVAAIEVDNRRYTPDVAQCLCARGVATPIQQAARRQVLLAHAATQDDVLEIALADELSSPSFQVATLLAADIHAELPTAERFTVHLTRSEAVSWLSRRAMRSSLGAAFPKADMWGARSWPHHVWDGTQIPSGSLADPLTVGSLVAHPRLHHMASAAPLFLWLDIGEASDGSLRLQWAMQQLGEAPPHPMLASHTLTFEPQASLALIEDCPTLSAQAHLSPAPPQRQPWWTPSRTATVITTGLLTTGFAAASLGMDLHADALREDIAFLRGAGGRYPVPWDEVHHLEEGKDRAEELAPIFAGVAIGAGAALTLSFTLPRKVFR